MKIDHGCRDVGVAEQGLDGPDIDSAFEQVGCETVSEGVATGLLGNTRRADRGFHLPLERGFVQMVAGGAAGSGVSTERRRRKSILPSPLLRCVRILPPQGLRKVDLPNPGFEITPMVLPEGD